MCDCDIVSLDKVNLNFVISQQSLFLSFCMVMVLVINVYCIAKELMQISQQVRTDMRVPLPYITHVLINLVCVDTLAISYDGWAPSDLDLQENWVTTVSMSMPHFTSVILIIAVRNTDVLHYMFSNIQLKCCWA